MSTTERDDLTEPGDDTRPLTPSPADSRDSGTVVGEEPAPRAQGGARRGRRRRRAQPLSGARVRRVVTRRVVVRKLDPWSVLKLSLIFYFALLLILMLGLTVFWAVVNRVGLVDTVLTAAEGVSLEVTYDMDAIARAFFLVGLLNVVLLSGVNVFLCFLYNLVADLVGGFRMTLAEEQ